MKKYSLLLASFLLILLGVGFFLEHESKYFSLLTARVLYSLGDFKDTKNVLDSRLMGTSDKEALAYGDSLLGNTKYRLGDLTGAVDSYSDSLRLYEDETVEKNREFVLRKLGKNPLPKIPPKEQSQQTPPPPAGSGSGAPETGSGAASSGSGSDISKSQSGSGKTGSGATANPGKTQSGSGATSSGS